MGSTHNEGFLMMAYLLPLIILGVLGVFCVVLYRLRKIIRAQEQKIERLQDSINAMCSGAVGMGEHLSVLEERSRLMLARQEKFELHQGSDTNYKFALKMAKNGADLEEVIEDCGIAHGEAELVLLANRMNST